MVEPLKTLADFKRRAVPGARFLRSFPGRETPSRIVTVAYAQSNAVVFPPNGVEATPDILKRIADNPGRNGSWFSDRRQRVNRFRASLFSLRKKASTSEAAVIQCRKQCSLRAERSILCNPTVKAVLRLG
jgi:hypothetical protein